LNTLEGKLKRNSLGRWVLGEMELTSGASVNLQIEGHWIPGHIEFWGNDYYWFSQRDGVPVVLHSGITARIFRGRYINE